MSQTERLYWLDAQIRDARFPCPQSTSTRLEVTVRTVHADIAYLRDRLHAPVHFDYGKGGWAYTDPTYRLPFLLLTDRETAALRRSLLVAQEYAPGHRGRSGQILVRGVPRSRALRRAEAPGQPAVRPRDRRDPGLIAVYEWRASNPGEAARPRADPASVLGLPRPDQSDRCYRLAAPDQRLPVRRGTASARRVYHPLCANAARTCFALQNAADSRAADRGHGAANGELCAGFDLF